MARPLHQDSLALRTFRKRFVERVEQGQLSLPLLSATALQVLQRAHSDDEDAQRLAELVQNDPALTVHVLRLANSAAFGSMEPIVSLPQAIARLGTRRLTAIAVAVVVRQEVFRLPGYQDRLDALWCHCALTAAWAAEIARLRRSNVEAAFLAGLLHDVGQPVVLQAIDGLKELGGLVLEASQLEDWVADFHEPVAARMLQEWGFPERLVQAVAHHHDPARAEGYREDAETTRLADRCAHWSAEADEDLRNELKEALRLHPGLAALNLYQDQLEELLEGAERVQTAAAAYA